MTRAPLTHAVPPATVTAGRTATARRRRRRQCQAATGLAGQIQGGPRPVMPSSEGRRPMTVAAFRYSNVIIHKHTELLYSIWVLFHKHTVLLYSIWVVFKTIKILKIQKIVSMKPRCPLLEVSSIPLFPHDHWSLWHCSIKDNTFDSPRLMRAGFLIALLLTRKDRNQRHSNFATSSSRDRFFIEL